MVICCILHCFVGKFIFSLSIYAVLSQNCFLQFTRFCVEKFLQKIVPVEKNDKYQVSGIIHDSTYNNEDILGALRHSYLS